MDNDEFIKNNNWLKLIQITQLIGTFKTGKKNSKRFQIE